MTDLYSEVQAFLETPENKSKLLELAADKQATPKNLFAFTVDLTTLDKFNRALFDALFDQPDEVIKDFKDALKERQLDASILFENPPEYAFTQLSKIRHAQANKLIAIQGILLAITKPLSLLTTPNYQCGYCQSHVASGRVDGESIIPPSEPCKCGHTAWVFDSNPTVSEYVDYIDALIEECPEETEAKREPDFYYARLTGILASEEKRRSLVVGDKLNLVGAIRLRQVKKGNRKTPFFENYIDLMGFAPLKVGFESIQLKPEEEKQIVEFARDHDVLKEFLKYFDDIHGMENEKTACLLQLFEGTPKVNTTGEYVRNKLHIFLLGDTSTAKNTLLQLIKTIHPRCVYLNADQVTRVGLTAMVVRDENTGKEFIKAGALMKASHGLVELNEFDSMDQELQAALASPMEEGVMGLAKFAISAEFRVTPSILAAGNPPGGMFDPMKEIFLQLPINQKLVSRFDLIYGIRDIPEPTTDASITKTMRQSWHAKQEKNDARIQARRELGRFITRYIAYAKTKCFPRYEESVDAVNLLEDYYNKMRKQNIGGRIAIKPRNYAGLVRLAEANAKLRLRNHVTEEDVRQAIKLFNEMALSLNLISGTGEWDISSVAGVMPKTLRDQKSLVMGVIIDLQREFDSVQEVDVIKTCKERYQLDEIKVTRLIDEMKRVGELFSPKPGEIKHTHYTTE